MAGMDQELANFFKEVDQVEQEVSKTEEKQVQKPKSNQQPQQQQKQKYLQPQPQVQPRQKSSSFDDPLPPPPVPPPVDVLPPPAVPPPSIGAEIGPGSSKNDVGNLDAQIMLGPQPLLVMPNVRGVSGTVAPLPVPEQKPPVIEVKPPNSQNPAKNSKGIKRMAAGKVWWDQSLSEWPPGDFRLFVGDLGNEVTDEVLSKAFSRYPSFQKAKVVRHKRTNKTKGFGFVSFGDAVEGHKALKEMDGKYIGNRPCKLKKSSWGERNINSEKNKQEIRLKRQKLGVQQI